MRKIWKKFRDLLLIVFLTILFAAGLKSCVIDAYKIPTASMSETLTEGDFLLVNKFVYGAVTPKKFLYVPLPQFRFPKISDVRRGDVIVFEFPGEPDEAIPVRNLFLVKRCVGLPGDTIDIVNGTMRVNGLRMNFFDHINNDFSSVIVPFKGMEIALTEQNFRQWNIFIRREGSLAERSGKKIFIDGNETASYIVKNDYYFAVGDNINNSSDSRAWGFIPEENISGKAMMVYWSKGDEGIRWNRLGTIIR